MIATSVINAVLYSNAQNEFYVKSHGSFNSLKLLFAVLQHYKCIMHLKNIYTVIIIILRQSK